MVVCPTAMYDHIKLLAPILTCGGGELHQAGDADDDVDSRRAAPSCVSEAGTQCCHLETSFIAASKISKRQFNHL